MDRSPFFVFNNGMIEFENHPQWEALSRIDRMLRQHGYQSLLAGGAVRDLLLGRVPNDMDLATDATPEQVAELFEKTVMVGEAFGVTRVVLFDQVIEVATFRKDGVYLDGRKPESVEFSSPEEDAKRRDFTINALFYDLKSKEVIDYVGGQKDIMKRIIRTVGDPNQRFKEDKLRILRALRFYSQLGFEIEEKTLDAISDHGMEINQVSMERIRDEWEKLLQGPHRLGALQRVHKTHLWKPLFSPWDFKASEYSRVLGEDPIESDRLWILWFMIHEKSKSESLVKKLQSWKLGKKLSQKIEYSVVKRSWFEKHSQWDALDFAIVIDQEKGKDAFYCFKKLHHTRFEKAFLEKVNKAKDYFVDGKLPRPLVTGTDLLQYGLSAGPQMAEKLKKAYRLQLEKGFKDKEVIIQKLV